MSKPCTLDRAMRWEDGLRTGDFLLPEPLAERLINVIDQIVGWRDMSGKPYEGVFATEARDLLRLMTGERKP